jgi:hypothetical protein
MGVGVVVGLSLPAPARAQDETVTTADAAPVEEAVVAGDAECFPPCRSGYLCHLGRCIEACNPPCPEGERCNESGECVSKGDTPAVKLPDPVVRPEEPVPTAVELELSTPVEPEEGDQAGQDRPRPVSLGLGIGAVLCTSKKGCNTADGDAGVSGALFGAYKVLPWLAVGAGASIAYLILDDPRDPTSLFVTASGQVTFLPLAMRARVVEPVLGLRVGYALGWDSWEDENGVGTVTKLHGLLLEYMAGVDFHLGRVAVLGVHFTVSEPLYFTSCYEIEADDTVDLTTGTVGAGAVSSCSTYEGKKNTFFMSPELILGFAF